MKILVIAGGLSTEREVSLCSGSLIANALCENGHEVAFVDLYFGVKDINDCKFTENGGFSHTLSENAPDIDALIAQTGRSEEIGENVIELCHLADVVFLALHGGIGENGKLQKILDSEGIKYTGSSSESCCLAMDKGLAKVEFQKNGIRTADWIDIEFDEKTEDNILENIGVPCVIKPVDGGSSVGVSIVMTRKELKPAIENAKAFSKRIVAEKFIKGREFAVGVLDSEALPPIEIIANGGFYDYRNKYIKGMAIEKCPCDLPERLKEKAQAAALAAHKCLGLGCYSRADLILQEGTEDFYILEVNALPGMTPTSLMPQMAKEKGISYNELCEIIIKNCINS